MRRIIDSTYISLDGVLIQDEAARGTSDDALSPKHPPTQFQLADSTILNREMVTLTDGVT